MHLWALSVVLCYCRGKFSNPTIRAPPPQKLWWTSPVQSWGWYTFAVLLGSNNSYTTPFWNPFFIRSLLWWWYMVGGPLNLLPLPNHSLCSISSKPKGPGEQGAAGFCPRILLLKRAKTVLCPFHRSHREICTRSRPVSETKFLDDFCGPFLSRPLCFAADRNYITRGSFGTQEAGAESPPKLRENFRASLRTLFSAVDTHTAVLGDRFS